MKKTSYNDKQKSDIAAFCARTGQSNPFDAKEVAPSHAIITESRLIKRQRKKTQAELQFEAILESRKRFGEIGYYCYEGIRLKWGDDMHYLPDFCAFDAQTGALTLYEVKGAHIFSRDIVRFKGCRAQWPQFKFELWQVTRGEWRRLF